MTTTASGTISAPVAAPRANGDWLTLTLRMIRWNLFQIWRRLMSKVLIGVLLGIYALVVLALVLAFAASRGASARAGADIADLLTFPRSTAIAVEYVAFFGMVLCCILAGALVGGEYGFNTMRLALSRGIGRGQVIVAQTATLAILAFATACAMAVIGSLVGITLGPLLGGSPQGLGLDGMAQLASYVATTGFRIFTYTLLALLFGTLTRSTAGGIGIALGFVVFELVGLNIMLAIITGYRTAFTFNHVPVPGFVDTLVTVRAAFVQTNADALVGAAREGPLTLTLVPASPQLNALLPTPPSATQALLVLLLWCAVAVALSYWLTRQRDVTD